MSGRFWVCVFCGAKAGTSPRFAEAAARFGARLAARGLGLVYGGGQVGLMGVVAEAALAGGAPVTGVLPKALATVELAHPRLTELVLTEGLHARKARMASQANAFVALPGGFGTLDELFEVLTWQQLGLHQKPIGLLDVDGYFTPLVHFLDHASETGFLAPRERARLHLAADPDALLDQVLLPVA